MTMMMMSRKIESKNACRKPLAVSLVALLLLLQIDLIRAAFEVGNNNNVKITEHGLQLTQTINVQRQEYLQRQCEMLGYANQTINDLTDSQMDHMIVDEKHKFLYCYVPKVACTNWKRVLMLLTGKWQKPWDPMQIPSHLVHTRNMFRKFSALSPAKQQQVLSGDYTRFMLARHPFERMLSAYRNKFEGNTTSAKYFHERYGRKIVKAIRAGATKKALDRGSDVAFGEFVQYLLRPEVSLDKNNTYNEHWEPIAKLCNPCVMKYNVIGKYETLLDDSALALYLTGTKNITFPTGYKTASTRELLRSYFEPLPLGSIRHLYEIYKDDFRLFDYGLADVLGFELG